MKKIYWYIICDGKLFLPNGELPCEEFCPVAPAEGMIVFGLGLIDGVPARAVCCQEKLTDLVGLRDAYELLPEKFYKPALVALEKVLWDLNSQRCPVCGGRMDPAGFSSKRCCTCGKPQYTIIAPAAIILIKRKKSALLVRAKNFRGSFYGLVAGFVELGESLEECVVREAYEETGLKLKNLKYFGSQIWPYPNSLMLGFTAEAINGDITLQDSELTDAQFFTIDNLPELPRKDSLARKLIDSWIAEQTAASIPQSTTPAFSDLEAFKSAAILS
ncbi:MAG: NAD(+) diphosphatase [Kiritimatiellae bacterium]|nr:NAD(+) diphosphatase [Kiritimatiellia bacterium]